MSTRFGVTVLSEHAPVMLDEAIIGLNIKPDGVYIDATFGRGGHSKAILQQLGDKGRLIVLDRDETAIECAKKLMQRDGRITAVHQPFSNLLAVCTELGVVGMVDGILFDLGVSSPQLDTPSRGFSFMHDGPLDMRMDTSTGITAEEWLKIAKVDEIKLVLKNYGDEKFAGRIAKSIVESRAHMLIDTTKKLVEIVTKSMPFFDRNKHPATRTFQAIRMHINQEEHEVAKGIEQALTVLKSSGRMCVISFHSVEDRIVKIFINKQAKGDELPRYLPVTREQQNIKMLKIGKAQKPSDDEIKHNVRARSAILRVAEKL